MEEKLNLLLQLNKMSRNMISKDMIVWNQEEPGWLKFKNV